MERTLLTILVFIFLCSFVVWPVNLYKLTQCDWEADYKCEAIHALGVFIPPTSYVTVFYSTDGE